LAHPTTCNLVAMTRENYHMEVRKGPMYRHQALPDDVQIDIATYVVVRVDMVHENMKNIL
jgi:hypothetical protein